MKYGIPEYPIGELEQGAYLIFGDPENENKPVKVTTVTGRCRDKWLCYDRRTGIDHKMDPQTGKLPCLVVAGPGYRTIKRKVEYQLLYVGHRNQFEAKPYDDQLHGAALLAQQAQRAAAVLQPVGRMAPTYPSIMAPYNTGLPYTPTRGDYACFVDTRSPQCLSQVIMVRGRRGNRWWGDQINGTSSFSFDPATGKAKPFGHPLLLAWVCGYSEFQGGMIRHGESEFYTDVWTKVEPLIAEAYGSLVKQSLITNPL